MDAASDPPMGLTENSAPMYFSSAISLYKKQKKTLALNSSAFVDFGYLKDLTEILYRILEGPGRREGLSK
ncbi:hypothetical protein AB3S75_044595 [Citrus x aurantiifolia]